MAISKSWIFTLGVVLLIVLITGSIAIARNHNKIDSAGINTGNNNNAFIDKDGKVINGPFQTCECSGSIFFGEDRIQCYDTPQTHFVGDMLVVCVWNDMVQIERIQEIKLRTANTATTVAEDEGEDEDGSSTTNSYHSLVEDGIPDIMTHVHIRDPDRLVAVIATTLDASWFPNNSTIGNAVAVVHADGVFGVSEQQQQKSEERRGGGGRRLGLKESMPLDNYILVVMLIAVCAFVFVTGCLMSALMRWNSSRNADPSSSGENQQQQDMEKIAAWERQQEEIVRSRIGSHGHRGPQIYLMRQLMQDSLRSVTSNTESTLETDAADDAISVTCTVAESLR